MGKGSNPYLIDNKVDIILSAKSVQEMRSTNMCQKRKALSDFMGKKSNDCILLIQNELSPKLGGGEKKGRAVYHYILETKRLSANRQKPGLARCY
jgi:hypothetical protein